MPAVATTEERAKALPSLGRSTYYDLHTHASALGSERLVGSRLPLRRVPVSPRERRRRELRLCTTRARVRALSGTHTTCAYTQTCIVYETMHLFDDEVNQKDNQCVCKCIGDDRRELPQTHPRYFCEEKKGISTSPSERTRK